MLPLRRPFLVVTIGLWVCLGLTALDCGGSTRAQPADASTDLGLQSDGDAWTFDSGDGGPTDAATDAGKPELSLPFDGGIVLPYAVVAADYSRALDRLAIVGNDQVLHVVDPHSHAEQTIAATGGVHVAVSPDGHHAAVAQESLGQLSYYDLSTASLIDTYSLGQGGKPRYVLLGDDGRAYAFLDNFVSTGAVQIVDLATRALTPGGRDLLAPGAIAPGSSSFWAVSSTCPAMMFRYLLFDGGFTPGYLGWILNPCCEAVWPNLDASALVTSCGDVFDSHSLLPRGRVGTLGWIGSIDFHSTDQTVAALASPPGEGIYGSPGDVALLQIYDPTLVLRSSVPLPAFASGAVAVPSFGVFVFHDSAGQVFAIIAGPASSAEVPSQLTYGLIAL